MQLGVSQLDAAEVEALFAPLIGAQSILVAVSGGPDSIALLGLLAEWGRVPICAATVDHRLRPESGTEARGVAAFAAKLNVPHAVLEWQEAKTGPGLQERARNARYALLSQHMAGIAGCALVTAHTRDDQSETILMRMARGSGLAGLAGLRADQPFGTHRLVRPLLCVAKARLIATCEARNWAFVDDVSNRNEAFTRVRWRKHMPLLAKEGLDAERLVILARRLEQADEALMQIARNTLGAARSGSDIGATAILSAPFAVAQRCLALLIAQERPREDDAIAPFADVHLRLDRLEAATARLQSAFRARERLRLTLAGMIISLSEHGLLRVVPEGARKRGRGSKPL